MGAQRGVTIEILERDKEQTLKTLWEKEKLDKFFPRQELVEEMHKLHEERLTNGMFPVLNPFSAR